MKSTLAARLVIEKPRAIRHGTYGRHVPSVNPSSVDWPALLETLRTADFTGAAAKRNAVQLLTSSGYAPVTGTEGKRRVARWTPAHITAPILERVQTLQQAVRVLSEDGPKAIREAAKFRAAYQSTLNKATSQRAQSRSVNMADIETRTENWLKRKRVDIPPTGEPNRLAKLFGLVRENLGQEETLEQVMQRIAPGMPLPKLKYPERPLPYEVLKHLLNFAAADAVDTRLTFDQSGMPVVSLTPRDIFAALLLKAHEQWTLTGVLCAWCGNLFTKARINEKGCSEKCKNNLKVTAYRTRKALQNKIAIPKGYRNAKG